MIDASSRTRHREEKAGRALCSGENEYVIDICADYIFLANAVNDLLREESRD